ncbi:hypothetical protein INT47_011768 [Mucor saturninus]|uniref:DNA/RNA-binding protein Kin17 WH-like domain-containing protein n=1 Tax=Mucor saturninus TaxID=64648 RepID=A0A8H7QM07_9FUNG|nr:hypothetical protein INT47_011768 [Mucor saturninus]
MTTLAHVGTGADFIFLSSLKVLKGHSSERQGRDENGCNCHIISASYQCQMLLVAANPGRYFYNFSDEFKKEIRNLLSRRHGTKRVFASKIYQEYIAHKEHIHKNATRWNSLKEQEQQPTKLVRDDEQPIKLNSTMKHITATAESPKFYEWQDDVGWHEEMIKVINFSKEIYPFDFHSLHPQVRRHDGHET